MLKRFYFETNAFNGVIYTDGEKAVMVEYGLPDFESALGIDYSGVEGFDDIEALNANYGDGNGIFDFVESEYELLREF